MQRLKEKIRKKNSAESDESLNLKDPIEEAGKFYCGKNCSVYQDMTLPLAHYFVSSSHNTYLHGHQLVGEGGTDMIAKCLIKGCRVVELDVYNAETNPKSKLFNQGPVVRHGEALTSAVTLKECLQVVVKNAFKTSVYPVVLTFENHCDLENQVVMAGVIHDTVGDMLLLPQPEGVVLHESPEQLKGKIVIRAKVEGKDEAAPELRELVYIQNVKLAKVLSPGESLDPNAKSCSVEAGKLEELQEDRPKLLEFTTKHLLRIYPQAWRINSNNYNPVPAWGLGAQVVALNWQKWDKEMWIYEAKFCDNGGCGFVKKPDWMIAGQMPPAVTTPKQLKVVVHTGAVEYIKRKLKVNYEDLFVKMEVFGEPCDEACVKTRVVDNTHRAFFGEEFVFQVSHPELAILVMQLKDYDRGKDDMLGYFALPLNDLNPGDWIFPIKDSEEGTVSVDTEGKPIRWITCSISWIEGVNGDTAQKLERQLQLSDSSCRV